MSKALAMEMPAIKLGLVKVTDAEEIESHRWDMGDDSWGASIDAPERLEWPTQ